MMLRINPRRGSVGAWLIMVMTVVFILLPLSVTLIRQLHSRMMINQAEQLIEETMNSCLLLADRGALSDGQFRFSLYQLQQHAATQLTEQLPPALDGYFQFDRVEIQLQPLRDDELLWHAGRETVDWPVLTCYATVTDYRGRRLPISRSVICRFGRSTQDCTVIEP